MTPKVLIFVDDGRIDVMHTRGVEVAVLVEGEDVEVPDDWVGLLGRQHHSLPITVNRAELPQKRPLQCPETQLAAPNTQVQHATAQKKAEECPECGEKHGEQSGCDGLSKFPNGTTNLMNAPYCYACDGNHPEGECPRPGDVFDDLGSS